MSLDHGVQRIEVQGYRALFDTGVDLGPLNILIGPNGTGKSSFLDIFKLLSQVFGEGIKLGELLSQRGGMARMLTLGRSKHLQIRLKTKELSYDLRIAPQGIGGFVIAGEDLYPGRPRSKPSYFLRRDVNKTKFYDPFVKKLVDWEALLPGDALALTRLPGGIARSDVFRTALGAIYHYEPSLIDSRSPLRLAQTLQPTSTLVSPAGHNLFSVLYKLRLEQESWYSRIEDVLLAGFPGFRKLDFHVVAGGQVTLAWYDSAFGANPLFANELSAGTLRFLHLATLLLCPDPPPLLLLDEPEESLHPELLRLLVELMMEAAERTQIIVATQSAPLLRWVKPDHVIVADRIDGICRLTRGTDLHLDAWLKRYNLEELWSMGQLGGKS